MTETEPGLAGAFNFRDLGFRPGRRTGRGDAADPELYRVSEQPIRAFLTGLRERYGGTRSWAQRRGVPAPLLDLLAARLTEPA